MTLYADLKNVRSEEDVKDAYIKALGLTSYTKGLIDIQTEEIWFEAKDTGKHSSYAMFTQLLHYVQDALNKGERIPPFLAVIDTEKAAIMKSADVLPFLAKKTIRWGKSASKYTPEALEVVSAYIGTYFVSFRLETHEEEFIATIKAAIQTGEIIRIQITPDNLKQVFDKWVTMIGSEIEGVSAEDYALLFFADIMNDGTVSSYQEISAKLIFVDGKPAFFLDGKLCALGNKEGYRQFWAIYHRPPQEEHRNYLLERRDSLIPLNERSFKGAYYTPLNVVDRAYDTLAEVLGKNWQKNYLVWDMCCGVGNLEVKHSNHRNLFMSTLDVADIDVMRATKTCVAATRFQYDYLNDDITDDGRIDYSLTNKLPPALRDAINEGKKILVLMNPPYAEAASSVYADSKKDVAKSQVSSSMMCGYGSATRELFTQFIARIAQEIPTATIAMFSKLKYINAPFFEKFRAVWYAKYLGGFVVHSKNFDGLKGDFPIGFLVWNTRLKNQIDEVTVEVLDKNANPVGEKNFYNIPNKNMLNVWIERPKSNKVEVIPLTNAVTPAAKKDFKTWSNDALAYLTAKGNDMQNANSTYILSSRAYGESGGIYINPDNLWQAAIIFAVRRLVKPTWLNDRDQFLQPTGELTNEFKHDCLIWMLFNGSNLTASADDLEWNGATWSIVNHFIPFTETEVNAPTRFESDFMVRYLKGKKQSSEAKAVLAAGKQLWLAYFAQSDNHIVRHELKLNRADVGWYQLRNALKKRNDSGDYDVLVSFAAFEAAYKTLTEKLQPLVYELGFLKR
ncbi:hypothetical protein CKO12_12855 [Chromatium okenii]|uniref:hypothetical protein n=1 Tax=Chromatium okenii TaxID=61644 RepID=UPI001904984A|nr:hypothetical protein [Chromatium okenii]MBK1642743.1 hypothetical protein [Chromatium okenii]